MKAAQADADKARRALLPRIPSVQLTLQPPVVDAQVTLDGKPVPPAMVGVMRPLDPGAHTAQVLRGRRAHLKRSFTLQESDHTTIVLEVPGTPGAGTMPPYPPARCRRHDSPPPGGAADALLRAAADRARLLRSALRARPANSPRPARRHAATQHGV